MSKLFPYLSMLMNVHLFTYLILLQGYFENERQAYFICKLWYKSWLVTSITL